MDDRSRLSRPELTAERFTRPEKFDLDGELSGSLGVFKGDGDYEVVVDFDAWGRMTCGAGDGIRARNSAS